MRLFIAIQFPDRIRKASFPVTKISLMKSERKDGKIVYTEIYAVSLKEEARDGNCRIAEQLRSDAAAGFYPDECDFEEALMMRI